MIDQSEHVLFWGFEERRGYVLGLAETECELYHRDGRLIGAVPVEPPYEIVEAEDHIAFETSRPATQRIAFPVD